ncbi:hypothetical protein NQ318_001166 [Aromia moschata]|uniref:Uncharacterized protein n=1 Tax=Aromia moschata TaxID=1265417 RepID=A0AAV8ZGS6_9CUCU|nr:hypothetical protein NQ318_001166 [Aromia moschata]
MDKRREIVEPNRTALRTKKRKKMKSRKLTILWGGSQCRVNCVQLSRAPPTGLAYYGVLVPARFQARSVAYVCTGKKFTPTYQARPQVADRGMARGPLRGSGLGGVISGPPGTNLLDGGSQKPFRGPAHDSNRKPPGRTKTP